jgi:hypothetical protein
MVRNKFDYLSVTVSSPRVLTKRQEKRKEAMQREILHPYNEYQLRGQKYTSNKM